MVESTEDSSNQSPYVSAITVSKLENDTQVEEEVKGQDPLLSFHESNDTQGEDYDTFDEEVMSGAVDVWQLMQADSHVSVGNNRRVTSMHEIRMSRVSQVLKPMAKSGVLKKYSPALFRGWQLRTIQLNEGILKYFKEKNGELENMGTLNFDLYQCIVTRD